MENISDLPLEERHAIVRQWLEDLTTIYEKTAAERDALREENKRLRALNIDINRQVCDCDKCIAIRERVQAIRERKAALAPLQEGREG